MNGLRGLKGFKGLTTVGVLLSIALIFVISAMYVIPAFAVHSLTLANVTPTNVTAGQKLPSLNFTFTSGGSGNITNVLINFSVIGNNAGNFTVPVSNDSVVCGGKTASLPGWVSRINATAVTCYNTTQDSGARIVFNVSIINTTVGIYAGSASGLYLFNITTTDNDTETNTTTVGVDVKRITGRATTNVTSAEIGKNQSISFTITAGSDLQKSINKIVINFSSAGFIAPTTVSCPGLGDGWGTATVGANDVTCTQGGGLPLTTGSTTIILNGTTAGQTPGIQPFNVGLYDTTVGEYANFTNSTTIAVYGLLNITGTNTIPGNISINKNSTDNSSLAARFNFSARGEQMNVSMITLLRTGSATGADISEVAIYNGTQNSTNGTSGEFSLQNATLIAINSSAPDSLGRYVFSGIAFNVSAVTDQFLFVTFNITRSATAGRNVGFMINNTGNVTTTSAISGQSITEALVTTASNNATIVGNLTITGTDAFAAGAGNVSAGRTNVSVITYNFAPSGEQMNITAINLSRTGSATDADIVAVGLYNSSGANDNTTIATLIAWNSSVPANGVYNFSGLGFNVTTSGNYLFVVVNISVNAIGGRTIGFTIGGASNITTSSSVSNQSITETLVTVYSTNATIYGNLTITGTNMAPATVILNDNNTMNETIAVRFNFSARGEGMNITQINITRTGTATAADIISVALYNATPDVAGGTFLNLSNATLIARNLSAPRADGTYNFTGLGFNVSTALDNFLIIAFNVSRSATGGRTVGFMINNVANVTTTSSISGQSITEYLLTTTSNNATIVGNLTITGTTDIASTRTVGSINVSVIRFNFAPSGEQMNITKFTLTRTGTATDADIVAVGLYNSSSDGSNVFTANATLIAWNTTPDSLGRYDFNNTGFNVTTSGNQLLVVVNLSSSATIGRTIGFIINGTGNITTTSSVSNQSITETLVTEASNNATIVGNLTITGTDRIGSSVAVGTKNVTAISFNFSVAGEQMNITAINLSRTGSATDADITAVGLYNGTNTTFTGSEGFLTLIAWNSSVPANGVYNFSGLGFNVTAGDRDGNILLVVVNLTNVATTGRTIGFRIDSAANISTASSITNVSITETLITVSSSNSSIYGNLTITGASQIAATVTVGQRNITVISYNFSALGEGMNMTGINLTLTGTVSTADIESVALYNGTNTTFNEDFLTLIARNTSAPRADGTYNFSGIAFNVSVNDRDGNMLLVVVNFTAGSTTTGGKTIGFKLNPAGNTSVVSAIGNVAITPILATTSSANGTIAGNLTVSTTSDISANVKINQKKVAFLNLSLMARGEVVNVTSINVTLRGNASFANVSEIKLFNDDGSATGSLDATDTLINSTVTAPTSARITFTPTDVIRLTPSTAKIIFVVLNVSDESDAGAVVGVQINATDVAATTNVTNQSLSTSWTAVASANRTIISNIEQQVVGKNAPNWARVDIPSQTIMESIGRTAGTTQNFNISKILYSLRTNYRFVYGNTDGTSSGWKLFDRTDWAGSSLQYANYTFNGGYVWVNMTAEDTFEL
ncbi:MAG: hypothetical protein HYT72_05555 [Candidatus Aenigmarchaeota archaeon]|nr:hypothetical protein [Candidatus Aenigmarchaeota archaeon]